MAMEISGNDNHLKADYAEKLREKRAAQKAEEAKEAERAEKEAEAKKSEKLPQPQDEYISSEKSASKPTGLYRVGQDENGNRKIFFDDPKKSQKEPEEVCVGNNDKAEREIERLKEKKQQLEQQIQSASGDEKKVRELKKKLAQVEGELSRKDNDTYRRQNTTFTNLK